MLFLDKNYQKISSCIFGANESLIKQTVDLSLLEDIDQSYIVHNQNELIGVIKKDTIIQGLDSNKIQTVIIVGISGLKYLEQQILELPIESQILIIEPNKELVTVEMSNFDLEQTFKRDISIYCDEMNKLSIFLNDFFSGTRLYRLGNLVTFINDIYLDKKSTVDYLRIIKDSISNKLYSVGNSIQDSLIGVEQNMQNIERFAESKTIAGLKNRFKNQPAIIISAGPSINKNIDLIKEVQNRYVIIAVDTIVSKLLDNGITPHFICSVERVEEVYTYFYKDKNYPEEITLVGPSLLRKEIFENFKGEKLLPLRKGVGEYKWLAEILDLGEDDFAFMGISCAHMALGIGEHLGCSPIVLVGQDLAYGNDGKNTHASGTIYDEKPVEVDINEKKYEVEAYNGGHVQTSEIWLAFKSWFERYIVTMSAEVINATEGGARIHFTKQLTLREVLDTYHGSEKDVPRSIKEAPMCQFDRTKVIDNLKKEREYIKNFNLRIQQQMTVLNSLKIHKKNGGNLEKVINRLKNTDRILNEISGHWLLTHLYQSHIVVMLWKYYKLDLKVNEQTVRENIKIQKELLEPIIFTNNKVIEYIDQAVNRMEKI